MISPPRAVRRKRITEIDRARSIISETEIRIGPVAVPLQQQNYLFVARTDTTLRPL